MPQPSWPGDAPGEQGAVQVWAPEPAAIRRSAWRAGRNILILVLIAVGLESWLHIPAGWLGGFAGASFCAFFASIRAIRRPCYLTVDDQGIGVTTSRSSRALRWDEIQSLETLLPRRGGWKLTLTTGETIKLNLTGYDYNTRRDLRALVTERANLKQHSQKKHLHLRAPAALPEGASRDGATR